jgi:hypothetical protein
MNDISTQKTTKPFKQKNSALLSVMKYAAPFLVGEVLEEGEVSSSFYAMSSTSFFN